MRQNAVQFIYNKRWSVGRGKQSLPIVAGLDDESADDDHQAEESKKAVRTRAAVATESSCGFNYCGPNTISFFLLAPF